MLLSLVMRIRLHVLLVSLFIMLFISLTVSLARAQPCLELKVAYLAMAAILNIREKSGRANYLCALFTARANNPKPKSGKARDLA
jgi:hypothetical protein